MNTRIFVFMVCVPLVAFLVTEVSKQHARLASAESRPRKVGNHRQTLWLSFVGPCRGSIQRRTFASKWIKGYPICNDANISTAHSPMDARQQSEGSPLYLFPTGIRRHVPHALRL